jgi:hypothetical protein
VEQLAEPEFIRGSQNGYNYKYISVRTIVDTQTMYHEPADIPKSILDTLKPIANKDDYLTRRPSDPRCPRMGPYPVINDEHRLERQNQVQLDLGEPCLPLGRIYLPDVDRLHNSDKDKPWGPLKLFESRLTEAHLDHLKANEAKQKTSSHTVSADERSETIEPWKKESMWARLSSRRKAHFTELQRRREYWAAQHSPSTASSATMDFAASEEVQQSGELQEYTSAANIFDTPNYPVGIFNRAEVDHYFERQRETHLKQAKKNRIPDENIDKLQIEHFGASGAELDARAAEARRVLMEESKILPPKPPAQKSKQKQTPKKKEQSHRSDEDLKFVIAKWTEEHGTVVWDSDINLSDEETEDEASFISKAKKRNANEVYEASSPPKRKKGKMEDVEESSTECSEYGDEQNAAKRPRRKAKPPRRY